MIGSPLRSMHREAPAVKPHMRNASGGSTPRRSGLNASGQLGSAERVHLVEAKSGGEDTARGAPNTDENGHIDQGVDGALIIRNRIAGPPTRTPSLDKGLDVLDKGKPFAGGLRPKRRQWGSGRQDRGENKPPDLEEGSRRVSLPDGRTGLRLNGTRSLALNGRPLMRKVGTRSSMLSRHNAIRKEVNLEASQPKAEESIEVSQKQAELQTETAGCHLKTPRHGAIKALRKPAMLPSPAQVAIDILPSPTPRRSQARRRASPNGWRQSAKLLTYKNGSQTGAQGQVEGSSLNKQTREEEDEGTFPCVALALSPRAEDKSAYDALEMRRQGGSHTGGRTRTDSSSPGPSSETGDSGMGLKTSSATGHAVSGSARVSAAVTASQWPLSPEKQILVEVSGSLGRWKFVPAALAEASALSTAEIVSMEPAGADILEEEEREPQGSVERREIERRVAQQSQSKTGFWSAREEAAVPQGRQGAGSMSSAQQPLRAFQGLSEALEHQLSFTDRVHARVEPGFSQTVELDWEDGSEKDWRLANDGQELTESSVTEAPELGSPILALLEEKVEDSADEDYGDAQDWSLVKVYSSEGEDTVYSLNGFLGGATPLTAQQMDPDLEKIYRLGGSAVAFQSPAVNGRPSTPFASQLPFKPKPVDRYAFSSPEMATPSPGEAPGPAHSGMPLGASTLGFISDWSVRLTAPKQSPLLPEDLDESTAGRVRVAMPVALQVQQALARSAERNDSGQDLDHTLGRRERRADRLRRATLYGSSERIGKTGRLPPREWIFTPRAGPVTEAQAGTGSWSPAHTESSSMASISAGMAVIMSGGGGHHLEQPLQAGEMRQSKSSLRTPSPLSLLSGVEGCALRGCLEREDEGEVGNVDRDEEAGWIRAALPSLPSVQQEHFDWPIGGVRQAVRVQKRRASTGTMGRAGAGLMVKRESDRATAEAANEVTMSSGRDAKFSKLSQLDNPFKGSNVPRAAWSNRDEAQGGRGHLSGEGFPSLGQYERSSSSGSHPGNSAAMTSWDAYPGRAEFHMERSSQGRWSSSLAPADTLAGYDAGGPSVLGEDPQDWGVSGGSKCQDPGSRDVLSGPPLDLIRGLLNSFDAVKDTREEQSTGQKTANSRRPVEGGGPRSAEGRPDSKCMQTSIPEDGIIQGTAESRKDIVYWVSPERATRAGSTEGEEVSRQSVKLHSPRDKDPGKDGAQAEQEVTEKLSLEEDELQCLDFCLDWGAVVKHWQTPRRNGQVASTPTPSRDSPCSWGSVGSCPESAMYSVKRGGPRLEKQGELERRQVTEASAWEMEAPSEVGFDLVEWGELRWECPPALELTPIQHKDGKELGDLGLSNTSLELTPDIWKRWGISKEAALKMGAGAVTLALAAVAVRQYYLRRQRQRLLL